MVLLGLAFGDLPLPGFPQVVNTQNNFESQRRASVRFLYWAFGVNSADITQRPRYIELMSSTSAEVQERLRAEYYARWAAVERVKAKELSNLTEEEARKIIQRLHAREVWREHPNWSGLVVQQAIFHGLPLPCGWNEPRDGQA